MIRLPERPKPGDDLRASWAGDVIDNLARLGLRFGRTIRAIRGSRGSATLEVDLSGVAVVYKAKSPASIVAANASATFTLYASIVSTTLASTTKSAKNGKIAIPANSDVWLVEQDGLVAVLGFWC